MINLKNIRENTTFSLTLNNQVVTLFKEEINSQQKSKLLTFKCKNLIKDELIYFIEINENNKSTINATDLDFSDFFKTKSHHTNYIFIFNISVSQDLFKQIKFPQFAHEVYTLSEKQDYRKLDVNPQEIPRKRNATEMSNAEDGNDKTKRIKTHGEKFQEISSESQKNSTKKNHSRERTYVNINPLYDYFNNLKTPINDKKSAEIFFDYLRDKNNHSKKDFIGNMLSFALQLHWENRLRRDITIYLGSLPSLVDAYLDINRPEVIDPSNFHEYLSKLVYFFHKMILDRRFPILNFSSAAIMIAKILKALLLIKDIDTTSIGLIFISISKLSEDDKGIFLLAHIDADMIASLFNSFVRLKENSKETTMMAIKVVSHLVQIKELKHLVATIDFNAILGQLNHNLLTSHEIFIVIKSFHNIMQNPETQYLITANHTSSSEIIYPINADIIPKLLESLKEKVNELKNHLRGDVLTYLYSILKHPGCAYLIKNIKAKQIADILELVTTSSSTEKSIGACLSTIGNMAENDSLRHLVVDMRPDLVVNLIRQYNNLPVEDKTNTITIAMCFVALKRIVAEEKTHYLFNDFHITDITKLVTKIYDAKIREATCSTMVIQLISFLGNSYNYQYLIKKTYDKNKKLISIPPAVFNYFAEIIKEKKGSTSRKGSASWNIAFTIYDLGILASSRKTSYLLDELPSSYIADLISFLPRNATDPGDMLRCLQGLSFLSKDNNNSRFIELIPKTTIIDYLTQAFNAKLDEMSIGTFFGILIDFAKSPDLKNILTHFESSNVIEKLNELKLQNDPLSIPYLLGKLSRLTYYDEAKYLFAGTSLSIITLMIIYSNNIQKNAYSCYALIKSLGRFSKLNPAEWNQAISKNAAFLINIINDLYVHKNNINTPVHHSLNFLAQHLDIFLNEQKEMLINIILKISHLYLNKLNLLIYQRKGPQDLYCFLEDLQNFCRFNQLNLLSDQILTTIILEQTRLFLKIRLPLETLDLILDGLDFIKKQSLSEKDEITFYQFSHLLNLQKKQFSGHYKAHFEKRISHLFSKATPIKELKTKGVEEENHDFSKTEIDNEEYLDLNQTPNPSSPDFTGIDLNEPYEEIETINSTSTMEIEETLIGEDSLTEERESMEIESGALKPAEKEQEFSGSEPIDTEHSVDDVMKSREVGLGRSTLRQISKPVERKISRFYLNNEDDVIRLKKLAKENNYEFSLDEISKESKKSFFIAEVGILPGAYGLYAACDLGDRHIIGNYIGIISEGETNENSDYIFPCIDKKNNSEFIIDAEPLRNITAYVNHSQYANVITKNAKNKSKKSCIRYEISGGAAVNQQLFFDYKFEYFDGKPYEPLFMHPSDNWQTDTEKFWEYRNHYEPFLYTFDSTTNKHFNLAANTKWLLPNIFLLVEQGDVDAINLLNEDEVDLLAYAVNSTGDQLLDKQPHMTALMYACHLGKKDIILALLEKADCDRPTLIEGQTPLALLITNGNDPQVNEEIALIMLDHMAYPFTADRKRLNLFHYAIQYNLPKLAEKLIEIALDEKYPLFSDMFNRSIEYPAHADFDHCLTEGKFEMLAILLKNLSSETLFQKGSIDNSANNKHQIFRKETLLDASLENLMRANKIITKINSHKKKHTALKELSKHVENAIKEKSPRDEVVAISMYTQPKSAPTEAQKNPRNLQQPNYLSK